MIAIAQKCFDASYNGAYPAGSYIRLYVTWSNNVTNNTSSVTFQLESHVFSAESYNYNNPSWYIAVNGTQIKSGTSNLKSGGSEVVLGTITKTYTHDSNGDLSINVSAYYAGTLNSSGLGSATLGSTSVNLGNIARASTITSCAAVTLDNNCSVKWTPKSSSFKYKIKFSLSSWNTTTAFITPSTTSAYTYSGTEIPLAVANQITTATTGTMTATLYTYNSDGTQIGSASSKTFTVTIPSSVKPTISACSVARKTGDNTVIDGWDVYVKGYSKSVFTATATAPYSATITSFKITGDYTKTVSVNNTSLNHTSSVWSTSGSKSLKVTAVDSRGRSSTAYDLGSITVYAYSKPTISTSSVARGTSSNTTNAIVKADWGYSSVNSKNSATCKFKYKKHTDSSYTTYSGTIPDNTAITITGAFAVEDSSYDCLIVVTDALGNSTSKSMTVSTVAATMDFKSGGTGIALGKMAETADLFEVAWNSQFNKNVAVTGTLSSAGSASLLGGLSVKDYSSNVRTILDLIYPVGSIYLSVNSTSPADIYGGTWQRIKDKFLLAAGDTYAAGANGGEATHTLTVEEMPSHTHSIYHLSSTSGSEYGWPAVTGTHSDQKSGDTGGGAAHNNMPPYLAVYMWKRTA